MARTRGKWDDRKRGGLPSWYQGPKDECDRCGLTFYEQELQCVNGLWLCKECVDEDEEM